MNAVLVRRVPISGMPPARALSGASPIAVNRLRKSWAPDLDARTAIPAARRWATPGFCAHAAPVATGQSSRPPHSAQEPS